MTRSPPPEVGLIVTEALFGTLSAGGIILLPYLAVFSGVMGARGSGDPTMDTVLLCLFFQAMPLGVAQTIVGLANGSRYYVAETWPPALAGVLAEAGLLAGYFALGGIPGAVTRSQSQADLMTALIVASVVGVPLVQVAVVNLAKVPRTAVGPVGAAVGFGPGGFRLGAPVPRPVFSGGVGGPAGAAPRLSGLFVPLVNARF